MGDRLHRDAAPCSKQLCEVGYHRDGLMISAVRTDDFVMLVAGFEDCELASWNQVFLEKTPEADRPAVVRYLLGQLAVYAAERCDKPKPEIDVPEMSRLFKIAVNNVSAH